MAAISGPLGAEQLTIRSNSNRSLAFHDTQQPWCLCNSWGTSYQLAISNSSGSSLAFHDTQQPVNSFDTYVSQCSATWTDNVDFANVVPFLYMLLLFIYLNCVVVHSFHSRLPCAVVVYSTVVLMATMLLCWRTVRYISCSVLLSCFTVIALIGLHQKLDMGNGL